MSLKGDSAAASVPNALGVGDDLTVDGHHLTNGLSESVSRASVGVVGTIGLLMLGPRVRREQGQGGVAGLGFVRGYGVSAANAGAAGPRRRR